MTASNNSICVQRECPFTTKTTQTTTRSQSTTSTSTLSVTVPSSKVVTDADFPTTFNTSALTTRTITVTVADSQSSDTMLAIDSPEFNAALIGGIVGGIVALLLVIAVIVFLVVRNRRQSENTGDHHLQSQTTETTANADAPVNGIYGRLPQSKSIQNHEYDHVNSSLAF